MRKKVMRFLSGGYQFLFSSKVRMKYFHQKKEEYTERRIQKILEVSEYKSKNSLFIDCGTNLGQGFEFFRRIFEKEYFDYVMVEPNPNCVSYLKDKYHDLVKEAKLEILPKAASISDADTLLFGLVENDENPYSQGASIKAFHNTADYEVDVEKAITVKTFDFVSFLRESIKSYDMVFIKMDIEGAEYSILENIVKEGLSAKIKGLIVEFHSEYMSLKYKRHYLKKEKQLLSSLKKGGCKVFTWV
ncbi:FkbM family methyltransferase [Algoriphagus winogradskyi]|uniref:Methyltransferase, FkbM family n=1 Tax=Algoriphagus winogradskyi TaxID=237017 RepID=A0ABY1NWF6_9BACT|nr:methyltransferase, FkbM family [Algoriphagus winogradskyi]